MHLAGNRIYDGTNTASFTILTVANAAGADTVDVASGNATLASKDVGLRAITDFTTLTLGNNAAGDYTLTGATGSVDISALAVHLTGSRIYDGTNTASFSILTVANAAVGDTVDVASGNATLASKDVGLRAITDFTTLTLGNNAAGDYTLTGATGSVDISALAVHLAGNRIYDGTNTASFTILTVANAAGADTVDVASGNATLASKDVGLRAITDFTTLTLGNNAAGDYTLTGATGSVDIAALAVNLTGSRIYDGTNTASFSILNVANVASGDNVNVASGNATLASKDVGLRAITDFSTLTLGNNAAGDYTLTGAAGSVDISALAVHLAGSRIYDGTNTASFGILTVTNAAVGDTVDVASGNATLASKDVGSRAITDFSTLTLGNNAAGDYTLTGATGSVDISALAVHLTGSRTYDGTNTASFSILTVANAAVGDTVNVASGNATLASKDVGLRAITDFSTLTLGNNAAGDYTLTGATGSVDISALAVHLAGSRIYDGTNTASFGILTVTNAAGADTVDVASGNATLASKDVGLRAITDFGTLALGNNAAGDYTLTAPPDRSTSPPWRCTWPATGSTTAQTPRLSPSSPWPTLPSETPWMSPRATQPWPARTSACGPSPISPP